MVNRTIEFFKKANNLKWVKRRGWVVKVDVKEPESVADHCYLMALMCMVLADLRGINSGKAVRMALLHDLAESIIGDYMPEELSVEKKQEEENKAIKIILDELPAKLRSSYGKLWREYKEGSSKEAMLVHQVDKLEMALQASDYLHKGYGRDLLEQFFDSAGIHVKDKVLREILNSLKQGGS